MKFVNSIVRLLFVAREKERESVFYKVYLPLDLFKILVFEYVKCEEIRKAEIERWALGLPYCHYMFEIHEKIPKEFWHQRDSAARFCGVSGLCLKYVSGELKNDYPNITEIAIRQNCEAIEYAPLIFRSDVNTAIYVLSWRGEMLTYFSDEIKDNEEIVEIAVGNDGRALAFASKRLKDNKEIVKTAMTNYHKALPYASKRLQDDDELVGLCFSQWKDGYYRDMFEYDGFGKIKKFMMRMIPLHGELLRYADEELRDDKFTVLCAVKMRCGMLRFASARLKDDREVVRAAVVQGGTAFKYASYRLRSDKELIEIAMRKSKEAKKYAIHIPTDFSVWKRKNTKDDNNEKQKIKKESNF